MALPSFSSRFSPLICLPAILLLASSARVITLTADHTFSLGSTFTGNQTVTSAGNTFELGFFSPNGSRSVYLGIWYVGISPQVVVWVANRNRALNDSSNRTAAFALSFDGEFEVISSGGDVIWSTGTKGRNVSVAVLEDTGNLVLQDGKAGTVWESFAHPGNTWLPYMKLGQGMKLTSWLSSDNPEEGPYSLENPPGTTEYVTVWNGSKQYWSSGSWNGEIFANEPEMTYNFLFNFSLDSKGFEWYVYHNSTVARFVIQTDGQIAELTWSVSSLTWSNFWNRPSDPCDAYALCGPNGICNTDSTPFCSCPTGFEPTKSETWDLNTWSDGCKREFPLNCSDTGSDMFIAVNKTTFDSGNSHLFSADARNECETTCLRNCSCLAYSYDADTSNCSTFHDVLINGVVSSATSGSVYLRTSKFSLGASPGTTPKPATQHKSKSHTGEIVGVCVAVAFAAILVLTMFLLKRRVSGPRMSPDYIPGVLKMFSYVELQNATKNFSEKLGNGGFGVVFKGILPGSQSLVAVKKLEHPDHGEKQFRAEVSTVGLIQHVNLVRLLGFCCDKSHRLIVYEYMPNGSLDVWLKKSNAVLDWSTRFNIALGTARAIAYLHDKCRECIIHCDIKPENILLDAALSAKVSDFGLAKLVGKEFSRVLTTTRGTRGYLAPEWLAGLPITTKADVYSYGMTLLEIISGRRNIDSTVNDEKSFFPVWAAKQINEGNILSLADERLEGKVDVIQLKQAAFVAVWCIQDTEEWRPSMSAIVHVFEGTKEITPPPIPSSLLALVDGSEMGYSAAMEDGSLSN